MVEKQLEVFSNEERRELLVVLNKIWMGKVVGELK